MVLRVLPMRKGKVGSYFIFEMTAKTIIDRTTLRTSYANESAAKKYNYLRRGRAEVALKITSRLTMSCFSLVYLFKRKDTKGRERGERGKSKRGKRGRKGRLPGLPGRARYCIKIGSLGSV